MCAILDASTRAHVLREDLPMWVRVGTRVCPGDVRRESSGPYIHAQINADPKHS
jgi:hypothetical protein